MKKEKTTMTKKQLLKLDIWIARKVFGWIPDNDIKFNPNVRGWWMFRDDGVWFKMQLPEFSSDRGAAMDVLEKCGKKTVHGTEFVCLRNSPPGCSTLSKRGHWSVGRIKDGHWDGPLGQHEKLQIAICLYAQALFGGEKV